ncbi:MULTISPECIES: pentapeptide repeat-containing protein [Paenibacillus]|uniref:Pentapeptide repeat-containing protein n=1 Tax=Paenibacillus borealis TaxID=160799 RepID=A0ABX3H1H3_PAEBO|nr:pentapeptide repeat-containing protein [Paenibacillus borealis]OMD42356.1 hypothetical protein BSK56_26050 [Paenibacillus borealis]
MDKQAALQHFREQYFNPLLDEQLNLLETAYHREQGQLISGFKASFRSLCLHIHSIQQRELKGPVGYIHYSFLRTQVLEQTYHYMTEAYDTAWYEDDSDCKSTYDASWAYAPISTMLSILEQERKRYMGVLNPADIERLLLESMPLFHQFVSSILRLSIGEAVRMPEYQTILKAERLLIRTGEYMDISENIYVDDQHLPQGDEIREQLMQASTEEPFIYENLKHLSLHHLELMDKDLRYNDFSHSHLQGGRYHNCNLVGSRWQQADLEDGSFRGCLLTDADFRYAHMKGVDFSQASGEAYRNKGLRLPGLVGIHFEHANLDAADFTAVQAFEHAYFEGASMLGTRVPRMFQQHWQLSDTQRQSIVWIE